MLKKIPFIYLIFLVGCTTTANLNEPKVYSEVYPRQDTLFAVMDGKFQFGAPNDYKNKKGAVLFDKNTFEMCFTKEFVNYAHVIDREMYGRNMVAINRKKEVVFETYLYKGKPDKLSDGLMRIIRNGKIGYADKTGKIVIPAQFTCAHPFKKGVARVAYACKEGEKMTAPSGTQKNSWLSIDKKGGKVAEANPILLGAKDVN